MINRRNFSIQGAKLLAGASLLGGSGSSQAAHTRVVLSVPGPGNLLYLPITLASRLGLDQAQGLDLDIRYVGGGPQAFRSMLERNCDFSAGGLPALALQKLSGNPVVCITPLSRVPAYTLLVRGDLKGKVKTIVDLAGKVVGVKGLTPGGRSTSQLFSEHVFKLAGLGADRVNFVAVGQAYENQRAALLSGTVDAIMGDEPFATRLVSQKTAFVLADYHDLATIRKLMGGLFLNSHIATRDDVIAGQPEVAEKMVKMIHNALVWVDKHAAAEMVDALKIEDVQERQALSSVLKLHKNIYAPDCRFSESQIATVQRFLRATETSPAAQAFELKSLINARWAGLVA
jgi:NitT/TauT family transport system substrate-binding protein